MLYSTALFIGGTLSTCAKVHGVLGYNAEAWVWASGSRTTGSTLTSRHARWACACQHSAGLHHWAAHKLFGTTAMLSAHVGICRCCGFCIANVPNVIRHFWGHRCAAKTAADLFSSYILAAGASDATGANFTSIWVFNRCAATGVVLGALHFAAFTLLSPATLLECTDMFLAFALFVSGFHVAVNQAVCRQRRITRLASRTIGAGLGLDTLHLATRLVSAARKRPCACLYISIEHLRRGPTGGINLFQWAVRTTKPLRLSLHCGSRRFRCIRHQSLLGVAGRPQTAMGAWAAQVFLDTTSSARFIKASFAAATFKLPCFNHFFRPAMSVLTTSCTRSLP